MVLSTCARLDVYSYATNNVDLAAIVADDVGGRATRWRASRFLAPRYARPAAPALASRCGADAARHVFEVACFADLEQCEFDPFDSHQAHVVKQIKAAFDDAARDQGPCGLRLLALRLLALLRLALETGKGARDGRSCRQINKLDVAAAVEEKVLEPAVRKAAASFAALDAAPGSAN